MKIPKSLSAFVIVPVLSVSIALAADYTISNITNTATITDETTGHGANASLTLTHKQPNNTLLVQKWVDKPLPDLGERVTYTIRIKNTASELVMKNITLIDDFDETMVDIVGIDQSPDVSNGCELDFSGTKFFDGQCFFSN